MKNTILLFFLFSTVLLCAQKTYLHCGSVIDVASGKTLSQKTIIVSGETIESIKDGYATVLMI